MIDYIPLPFKQKSLHTPGGTTLEYLDNEQSLLYCSPNFLSKEPKLDIAHLFFIIVAILVSAKVGGELAERIGQPAVLGEMIAGVILGQSVLGVIPPHAEVLEVLAEIGVCILLFEIGLESDVKELLRVGVDSFLVAVVGVTMPFLFGYLVIHYWAYFWTIGEYSGHELTALAIFTGATLTATSVGITARVLSDLKKLSTSEAKIILGAAVFDDIIGLVILAVVSAMVVKIEAGENVASVLSFWFIAKSFIIAMGFIVVAVVLGLIFAKPLFDLVERMRVRGFLIVTAFSLALLVGALADVAGSAMIIGSFAAGLVLSRTNQFNVIEDRIKPVADILTPFFFVMVGAMVDVKIFNIYNPEMLEYLLIGLALLVIAIIGKMMSGFGIVKKGVKRLPVGVGMVPRGEVGLIFASVGLKSGLLTVPMYSCVTFVVMMSTFVTPPVLKVVFARVGGEGE